MCRLLDGAARQELRRALQAASSDADSPPGRATASAVVVDVTAAADGLATATLRHRVAVPAALSLLQHLLEMLAAAAGVS